MNGKDLEKALLWEAPHIGEKAPEQIPEAQDFCEGYKTFSASVNDTSFCYHPFGQYRSQST